MQYLNSTVLNEREGEEYCRAICTIPPSPEALVIVSNCVFPLMLMSEISDASRSGTESVESDLN